MCTGGEAQLGPGLQMVAWECKLRATDVLKELRKDCPLALTHRYHRICACQLEGNMCCVPFVAISMTFICPICMCTLITPLWMPQHATMQAACVGDGSCCSSCFGNGSQKHGGQVQTLVLEEIKSLVPASTPYTFAVERQELFSKLLAVYHYLSESTCK